MSDALMIDSCMCGYHYYQDVWDPVIGEQLECVQEPANLHDRYAVAVLKEETVVGHVSRKTQRLRECGCVEKVLEEKFCS